MFDGAWTVSRDKVERCKRQTNTPMKRLSYGEESSDTRLRWIVLSAFFWVMDFKLPEMDLTELADTANAMLWRFDVPAVTRDACSEPEDDVQRGRNDPCRRTAESARELGIVP